MTSSNLPIVRSHGYSTNTSQFNSIKWIKAEHPLMLWRLRDPLEALTLGPRGYPFRHKRNSQSVENKLAIGNINSDRIYLNSTRSEVLSKPDLNQTKIEENKTNNEANGHASKTVSGTAQPGSYNSSTGNQSTDSLRQIGYSTKVSGRPAGFASTKGYHDAKKSDCSGSQSCEHINSGDDHESEQAKDSGECNEQKESSPCNQRLRSLPKGENKSHTYVGKRSKTGAVNLDSGNKRPAEQTNNTNNSNANISLHKKAVKIARGAEKIQPNLGAEQNITSAIPKEYSGRRATKMAPEAEFSNESGESEMFKPMNRKPVARSGGRKARKSVKVVELSADNEEFYADRKWPSGVVKYTIMDSGKYDLDSLRERLEEVNRLLRRHTCTRLRELRGGGEPAEDYLVLDAEAADYVPGMVGGKQPFGSRELFEDGQPRQHTAMMVMTMLGFYFECSRHDRDDSVLVNFENIRADKLHHYDKLEAAATLALPYDFESATHPTANYWQDVGRGHSLKTLRKLDPTENIMRSLGEHERLLSKSDIVKINSIYGTDCMKNNSD